MIKTKKGNLLLQHLYQVVRREQLDLRVPQVSPVVKVHDIREKCMKEDVQLHDNPDCYLMSLDFWTTYYCSGAQRRRWKVIGKRRWFVYSLMIPVLSTRTGGTATERLSKGGMNCNGKHKKQKKFKNFPIF